MAHLGRSFLCLPRLITFTLEEHSLARWLTVIRGLALKGHFLLLKGNTTAKRTKTAGLCVSQRPAIQQTAQVVPDIQSSTKARKMDKEISRLDGSGVSARFGAWISTNAKVCRIHAI